MPELNDEIEMIKRMQLDADELTVVSRCESINEQTPLSKLFRLFGRYPFLLLLIFLVNCVPLVFFGNPLVEKWLHGVSYATPLLFLFLFFSMLFFCGSLLKNYCCGSSFWKRNWIILDRH